MKLKKKLVTLIFVLSFCNFYSQNNITLGFNAGLNYPTFKGDQFIEEYDSKLSYLIGASADYKINSKLFLSLNLNFEKKSLIRYYVGPVSSSSEPITLGGPYPPKLEFKTLFDYLTLPITLKYYFNYNEDLYINSGVYLGYLLNVKSINDGEKSDLDFNKAFNKNDFGLTLGFGYRLKQDSKNYFSAELRNNFGISDISKKDMLYNPTRINTINLVLNWGFNI